jgi:VWFA-related protein
MTQLGLTHRDRIAFLHRRRWLSLCIWGAAACLSETGLVAQDTAGQDRSAEASSTLTLQVFANLVRIPVLVLTPQHERLHSPIPPNRFSIQFGNEPSFRPKYVRREGDDPITLAFVVDTRRPQENLLPKIDEAIANLAPSYLRAGDRVSIYAVDCSKMNAVEDVPADRVQLKHAVDVALSNWTERQRLRKKPPCSAETHLWDDLGYVTGKLARLPGWRAIVAVTNGDDRKSQHTPDEVVFAAQNDQVTILCLDPLQGEQVTVHGLDPFLQLRPGPISTYPPDEQMRALCELSGGVRLDLYQSSAASRMQQFMRMLRERYILEFPRPAGVQAGSVPMHVRIDGSDAYIRPAGDGVPIDDKAFANESNPLPAPSPAAFQPQDNPTIAAAPVEPPQTAVPPATEPRVAQQPAPVESVAPSAAAPAAAPRPENAAQPTASAPLFTASARLTVEDVTVTDARLMPVHGLLQPDFLLKEDGKPQEIKNFDEYGTEKPSAQAAPPQLPANVYSNAQLPSPTTSAVNVLMLDGLTTGLAGHLKPSPENLMFEQKQSKRYLESMPAGTRVAILEMTDGLREVQGFTSDREVLLAAIQTIKYKPVAQAYFEPLPAPPPPMQWPQEMVRGLMCRAANAQSRMTLDALDRAAAFLSGFNGRKNLIWFTPGIPWLTQYKKFSGVDCLIDYTQELQRTYGLLTAARITLYPVDPRGLKDCSHDAVSTASANDFSSTGCQAALVEEHGSLDDMAKATGGTAYYDRNDLEAVVQEAIATGADYYSLAYVPPLPKYDGKYHTIDVKVDRPNLHLQYRPGYISLDLAKPTKPDEKNPDKTAPPVDEFHAAMVHGVAPSTQILFNVRVQPSTAPARPGDPSVIGSPDIALKGKPLVRYDFQYTIPAEQITLADGPDGTRQVSLELDVVAYDAEGRVLNGLSQNAKLDLKPNQISQFLQRPVQLPLQLDLPSGEIFVRLGVLDVPSNKMGTLEIPEKVAK